MMMVDVMQGSIRWLPHRITQDICQNLLTSALTRVWHSSFALFLPFPHFVLSSALIHRVTTTHLYCTRTSRTRLSKSKTLSRDVSTTLWIAGTFAICHLKPFFLCAKTFSPSGWDSSGSSFSLNFLRISHGRAPNPQRGWQLYKSGRKRNNE